MTWLWISAIVILFGAEIDAEMEHQTAQDTTTGPPRPMGMRALAWQTPSVRLKGEDMTNLLKIPAWADHEHIFAIVETPRRRALEMSWSSSFAPPMSSKISSSSF
jgi:hypothetical protein